MVERKGIQVTCSLLVYKNLSGRAVTDTPCRTQSISPLRTSSLEAIGRALLLTANGFHYFTPNAGTAAPFSMNVHLPSAHTRFSISIRFNWTYCSGDRPIAC